MQCETCSNYVYDEEYEGYICLASMDEDDMEHFYRSKTCPYWHSDDDYLIVRKQK